MNKDKKIEETYNGVLEILQQIPINPYEAYIMQKGIIKKLDKLFEAGRTEGLLSKIKA